jgi:hypothetical protein
MESGVDVAVEELEVEVHWVCQAPASACHGALAISTPKQIEFLFISLFTSSFDHEIFG